MKGYSAVVDTNILYAGLYSSSGASFQILRLIDCGRLIPILSTTLLFEYEEVLKRNQGTLKLTNRAIEDVLDAFCSRGESRSIHFLWRPQLTDPKDDHVLELAVAAGGVNVVTHNVKDFVNADSFGVRIVTPAKLLEELK